MDWQFVIGCLTGGSESLAGVPAGKSQDSVVGCSEMMLLYTGFLLSVIFFSSLLLIFHSKTVVLDFESVRGIMLARHLFDNVKMCFSVNVCLESKSTVLRCQGLSSDTP